METKTAFNMFDSATKVEPKKTVKDKVKIFVPGLESTLINFNQAKIDESNAKATKEMEGGKIKDIGKAELLKMFAKDKSRPESFQLCDGASKVLFICQDAYKKVEDAKLAELQASFPGVLEKTAVFTFNTTTFAKPGVAQAVSDAIMNCTGISDDDKKSLILREDVTVVKKGTIDRLLSFPNYETLFHLIEPTCALK